MKITMKVLKRYNLFSATHASEIRKALENATWYETETWGTPEDLEEEQVVDETDSNRNLQSINNGDLEQIQPDVVPTSGLTCATCGINFENSQDQRGHFRLDWHRYNVKRRSVGLECVNEERFFELMDGLSSISGSDEEEETGTKDDSGLVKLLEKTVTLADGKNDVDLKLSTNSKNFKSTPKLFFSTTVGDENRLLAAYKCIFPSYSKFQPFSCAEAAESLRLLTEKKPYWGIIMVSGGHFAAGIFKGDEEVVHKTFHSYTVRAKQGGSQGAKDSKSGTSHPKSAGASLRRYNEQSFNQHVQELLSSWKDKLEKCSIILYRAVSGNLKMLFGSGDDGILSKKAKHIRPVPFPTKRPTYKEVKRVLYTVSVLEVLDPAELDKKKKSSPKRSGSSTQKAQHSQEKERQNKTDSQLKLVTDDTSIMNSAESDGASLEDKFETVNLAERLEEFSDSLTSEERRQKPRKPKSQKPAEPAFQPPSELRPLTEALDKSREGDFLSMIPLLNLALVNEVIDEDGSTLLHSASKRGMCNAVWKLLELGADPCLKDSNCKYPYHWASSKECRKVYMRFQAAHPDKFDYRKAQIPGPLTKEMEDEKAEKQKLLNKQKREKEKLKKAEKKEKQAEVNEQQRFLNLSDREKRALAAERRLLGQAAHSGSATPVLVRCFECATDITGKVPFEYNHNVFCTPKCLAVHRKKFPTPLSR